MSILTVSQLTQNIKTLMEQNFKSISIVGEISGYRPNRSGHIYLSLKDNSALINCVIWSSKAKNLTTTFRDGDQVVIDGYLTLYAPYGKYQIVITSIQKRGVGQLYQKYEQLKRGFEQEGLFDFEKKKLPLLPKRVALITGKNSAAMGDFLKVAKERGENLVSILIVPTAVQGKNSPPDIVKNLKLVSKMDDIDLVVITRGGGSIEELWGFNDEMVVRAVSKMDKVIVTAVGHERDTTLVDYVSDYRAATPTEAAEKVFPKKSKFIEDIEVAKAILKKDIINKINYNEQFIKHQKANLFKALPQIGEKKYQLFNLKQRLTDNINGKIGENFDKVINLKNRVLKNDPKIVLNEQIYLFKNLKKALYEAMKKSIDKDRREFENLENRLKSISPKNVLKRGYALITDQEGTLVQSINDIKSGDKIVINLKDGEKSGTID